MRSLLPDAPRRLARLMAVIAEGERLAARVSARQSRLAPVSRIARALAGQARQERSHAAFASAFTAWSGEDRAGAVEAIRALDDLGRRLDHDLDHGRLAASLYGLQGVLDPLGEALLEQLAGTRHPSARILAPAVRVVLAQERGHARLGEKAFRALGGRWEEPLAAYRDIGRSLARSVARLQTDDGLAGERAWMGIERALDGWTA